MCTPKSMNWAPMMPMGELERDLTKKAWSEVASNFSLAEIEEAKKLIKDLENV